MWTVTLKSAITKKSFFKFEVCNRGERILRFFGKTREDKKLVFHCTDQTQFSPFWGSKKSYSKHFYFKFSFLRLLFTVQEKYLQIFKKIVIFQAPMIF